MLRSLSRFGAAAAIGAVALVVAAVPASAHVSAQPGELYAGSYATVTFRVPNESDTAATDKLVLKFPADVRFNFAFVQPHANWKHNIKRSSPEVGVGVHTVVWKVPSHSTGLAPGEFDEFKILAGPFPEGQVCFKAAQHYDDGTVVNWADIPTAEDPHPARPAPCVRVIPRPADGATVATSNGTDASDDATQVMLATAPSVPQDNSPVIMMGIAAAVLVGSGVLFGRTSLRKRAKG